MPQPLMVTNLRAYAYFKGHFLKRFSIPVKSIYPFAGPSQMLLVEQDDLATQCVGELDSVLSKLVSRSRYAVYVVLVGTITTWIVPHL